MFLGHAWGLWGGFLAVVAVLLALDLGVLHRRQRAVGAAESLLYAAGYLLLALAFGGWVGLNLGAEAAVKYLTGYVIEFSLAMDNIFVIALILGLLGVPREFQHRVLLYGVLGVIVLRGVMIASGQAMIAEYAWTLDLMAAFLVLTGLKMLWPGQQANPLRHSQPVLRFLRRHLRLTDDFHGQKFFVRLVDKTTGHYAVYMTPLLLALLMVELADAVFALDSIPAVFAVSTDPFIVFTSNIFAILGLRNLYFALAAVLQRFTYMKYALALVLVLVGGKVLTAHWLGWPELPALASLGLTLAILAAGAGWSLRRTREKAPKTAV
jgi:tellurite resistance protein TerC